MYVRPAKWNDALPVMKESLSDAINAWTETQSTEGQAVIANKGSLPTLMAIAKDARLKIVSPAKKGIACIASNANII